MAQYELKGQRDQLLRYAEQIGEEGLREGQLKSNMKGLDGLPGLKAPSVPPPTLPGLEVDQSSIGSGVSLPSGPVDIVKWVT